MAKPTLTIKGKFQNCLTRIVQHKIPTLTIRGFIVCCTNEKTKSIEQKLDWGNALIDAMITSATTFFSALGGGAVAGVNTINIIESAAVTFTLNIESSYLPKNEVVFVLGAPDSTPQNSSDTSLAIPPKNGVVSPIEQSSNSTFMFVVPAESLPYGMRP